MSPQVLPGTERQLAFRRELLDRGHLIETGVDGVYGLGPDFEDVRRRFDALVTRVAAPDDAVRMHFPPVLPLRTLEATGYVGSFPHLCSVVHAFEGDAVEARTMAELAEKHADWGDHLVQSDLALVPACCYPVYPAIAARGRLSVGGVVVDAGAAYAFRNEPSEDPARLRAFHQREIVRIGEPAAVEAWRDRWRDRSVALLRGLGLDATCDTAGDAFFGRAGRMLAATQRRDGLKFEVLAPIAGDAPTALASFNYHRDHFGALFGLELAGGGPAHTACLGFGEERVVMALLAAHGSAVSDWPSEVRAQLWEA
ncbi:MAG: amino acid--[acyl-carrier-protein] ligase [Solirubrobacterales bacterium]|nr:amino acid--[acyl-carrier-protein] ligase [Solirubrobacterales bacterium]